MTRFAMPSVAALTSELYTAVSGGPSALVVFNGVEPAHEFKVAVLGEARRAGRQDLASAGGVVGQQVDQGHRHGPGRVEVESIAIDDRVIGAVRVAAGATGVGVD